MKRFLKILGVIILVPYVLVALTITIFLLNYNDYGVTEIGGKSLIIVNDDELAPNYKKGDLVVVKNANNDEINAGDYIFFYEESREKKTIIINLGRVISKKKVTETETTYKLEGDVDYSSEYVIGTTRDAKAYSSLGSIIAALELRWVFLLFIIIPLLFIFLYEIYEFVIEVKKNMKEA